MNLTQRERMQKAAEEWLVANDWNYQKYNDKRKDREAYDTRMLYEISDLLEWAYIEGYTQAAKDAQAALDIARGALREIVDCPFTVDSATVPKIGITEAPPYQVVVVISCAWTRLQNIRKSLAAIEKELGE